jgi:thioredoxin 1
LPLTTKILKDKAFKDAIAFQVDFDSQKRFLQEHRVRWQSTLMVFKGKKEKGRSTGDLNKDSIRKMFIKGL